MKTKPDLGFWRLWDLNFGFFGVQIAYALQSAYVSRIFSTIGADPHQLSYFWILPPLMGLLVQPIVGTLSDRTWTRFGRRLPYLIIGAIVAVAVMCLLPNAGSFGFAVSGAIMFGLIALMLLDTSINMAMQPFKMLVGDMVNEKQKGKAYSIQSFLCNAGSVVGFILPFCLVWMGIKDTAPEGQVPPQVIWAFYIGAAVLIACVIYTMVKVKEWPPHVYNEYNGVAESTADKSKKTTNLLRLLVKAPKTFWTVSLVQFFCWIAFLFMWTYTTNTVAMKAFHTPEVERIEGIKYTDNKGDAQEISGNYILINDTVPVVANKVRMVAGVQVNGKFIAGATIVKGTNDTLVCDHIVKANAEDFDKVNFTAPIAKAGEILTIDGTPFVLTGDAFIKDYLSQETGQVSLTTADIFTHEKTTGKVAIKGANTVTIDAPKAEFSTAIVLNTASKAYNKAGDWVGILYAVQALASVLWAALLPRLGSRRFSYTLSLILGGAGFILMGFVTNQWMMFVPFVLIGCAWAAMLAWPFTILTNSLKGGNIGAYLGLFNCSITIPQIVGALIGGPILMMLSVPGQAAPQYWMMVLAGCFLLIGSLCVQLIKEQKIRQSISE